jgi:putative SOS response-associated peptidase YedK
MCGRYSISTRREALETRFHARVVDGRLTPRYNAAPSDVLPLILNTDKAHIVFARWGFTPEWAKNKKMTPMINARAESLADKPLFRDAFRAKRCLVLADGFYEWERTSSGKQPYRITLKDEAPFAFAGLWSLLPGPDGQRAPCFAIVTTNANERVAEIHNRMPGPSGRDTVVRKYDATIIGVRSQLPLMLGKL